MSEELLRAVTLDEQVAVARELAAAQQRVHDQREAVWIVSDTSRHAHGSEKFEEGSEELERKRAANEQLRIYRDQVTICLRGLGQNSRGQRLRYQPREIHPVNTGFLTRILNRGRQAEEARRARLPDAPDNLGQAMTI